MRECRGLGKDLWSSAALTRCNTRQLCALQPLASPGCRGPLGAAGIRYAQTVQTDTCTNICKRVCAGMRACISTQCRPLLSLACSDSVAGPSSASSSSHSCRRRGHRPAPSPVARPAPRGPPIDTGRLSPPPSPPKGRFRQGTTASGAAAHPRPASPRAKTQLAGFSTNPPITPVIRTPKLRPGTRAVAETRRAGPVRLQNPSTTHRSPPSLRMACSRRGAAGAHVRTFSYCRQPSRSAITPASAYCATCDPPPSRARPPPLPPKPPPHTQHTYKLSDTTSFNEFSQKAGIQTVLCFDTQHDSTARTHLPQPRTLIQSAPPPYQTAGRRAGDACAGSDDITPPNLSQPPVSKPNTRRTLNLGAARKFAPHGPRRPP